jgi:hypothetical protein
MFWNVFWLNLSHSLMEYFRSFSWYIGARAYTRRLMISQTLSMGFPIPVSQYRCPPLGGPEKSSWECLNPGEESKYEGIGPKAPDVQKVSWYQLLILSPFLILGEVFRKWMLNLDLLVLCFVFSLSSLGEFVEIFFLYVANTVF